MAKAGARKHPDQADLFDVRDAFPVRAPAEVLKALDFNRRIAAAMSEAIRKCGKSREAIAAEMTLILGYDDSEITVAQLNAYTSAARETHTISLVRFLAFVRATGCVWLWDVVLHDEGLEILEGAEAHLARAALYRKQAEELLQAANAALAEAPSQVRVRRGR
jgi:hypothetical protein